MGKSPELTQQVVTDAVSKVNAAEAAGNAAHKRTLETLHDKDPGIDVNDVENIRLVVALKALGLARIASISW